MKVYLAYTDVDGVNKWLLNPSFYDGDIGLFFTPKAVSIGIRVNADNIACTTKPGAACKTRIVLQQVSDALDSYGVAWSLMDKQYRNATRLWKGKLVDVLLVNFSLVGPVPACIGTKCTGKRVSKPSGLMVRYGG